MPARSGGSIDVATLRPGDVLTFGGTVTATVR
jgi:hypothetical protein